MQALVLTGPGKFEIREIEIPTPGLFEVQCRIRAVAICGSDPELIRGDLAGEWPPSYPFIAGHEWAGEVTAVGEGVLDFREGDRVVGEAHKGCGNCRNCLNGRYTICENYGKPETGHRHYGFRTQGAYAQYNVYSIKSISPLPDNVSFREGAMGDTAGVALHGVELGDVTPGGIAAIIGPGPIGLISMRLAKALGTSKTIMVGRGGRLAAAGRRGADALVDFEKEDPVAGVLRESGGLGVDQVFECSGAAGTLNQAVRMVRKGGRVSLLGVPPDTVVEGVPFKYIVHNEIAITGSRANPNVNRRVMRMISAGLIQVSDLVTHVFPLTDFEQALDTFVNRREDAIKVVIEPNGKTND